MLDKLKPLYRKTINSIDNKLIAINEKCDPADLAEKGLHKLENLINKYLGKDEIIITEVEHSHQENKTEGGVPSFISVYQRMKKEYPTFYKEMKTRLKTGDIPKNLQKIKKETDSVLYGNKLFEYIFLKKVVNESVEKLPDELKGYHPEVAYRILNYKEPVSDIVDKKARESLMDEYGKDIFTIHPNIVSDLMREHLGQEKSKIN